MNVLSDIEVCEQYVIDIISTLNVDKAVGHDIKSNRMLLAVKNEITKPLSILINRSLKEMFFFQISGKFHMSLICLKRVIHIYPQVIVQSPYCHMLARY